MQKLMEKVFKVKVNNEKENNKKVNAIEVKLYYPRDVGYSYWDGHRQERGYLLSMTPTEMNECDGYTTYITTMGSGGYIMLRKVNRKSAKVERELLAELTDEKIKEYIRQYIKAYKLKTKN